MTDTVLNAGTSGGTKTHRFKSTGSNKADVAKDAPGQLYGIQAFSTDETPVYVRVYDKATAPGTSDTPVWEGLVPGSTGGVGSGFLKEWPTGLDVFTAGIGYRITTGVADSDDTATSANEVIVNFEYK